MTHKRLAYTFAVLRYSHDVVSGEFLNVGVVVQAASSRACLTRMAESLVRLTLAFSDCNAVSVRKQLARVETALKSSSVGSLREALSAALPDEQGSFHWSDIGAGVCSNLQTAVDELFNRFVAKLDESYGELFDVKKYLEHIPQSLQISRPKWVQMDTASNDEWTGLGNGMLAAGVR